MIKKVWTHSSAVGSRVLGGGKGPYFFDHCLAYPSIEIYKLSLHVGVATTAMAMA